MPLDNVTNSSPRSMSAAEMFASSHVHRRGTSPAAAQGKLSKLQATRLWLSTELDTDDREALSRVCGDVRGVPAGAELIRSGMTTDAVHILLDGWAARYTIMLDGSRFISALAVPGEICDLDAVRYEKLNYSVTMLSTGTVAVLPRARLEALFASNPAIADAFWSLALAENSVLTAWAASIARRSARDRLAHVLCELLLRTSVSGSADGQAYDLPLTQEQLADMVGLTPVHVNRTLQSLRSAGLISVQQRRVTIHDWPALCGLCGFQADYLHLETVDAKLARELPAPDLLARRRLAQPVLGQSVSAAGTTR